jgi:outer membrane protein assembly factor BamB
MLTGYLRRTLLYLRVKDIFMILSLVTLTGCGDTEIVLEGKRFDALDYVFADKVLKKESVSRQKKLNLSKQKLNKSWTHRNGSIRHSITHPSLNRSFKEIWSVGIGTGNTRKTRITSDPIVSGNLIYTLDSTSTVTATNLNGSNVWSTSLVPKDEKPEDASGGAVSFSGGVLYAVTGFGDVFALDSKTGKKLWVQNLGSSIAAAATIEKGTVYVVTRDSNAWALSTSDGDIKWSINGAPGKSLIVGGASPAIGNRVVIFPSGSGEVIAVEKTSGIIVWSSFVTGERSGMAYSNVVDITGDPVIVGDRVYVANQSGLLVALNIKSGQQVWTFGSGSYSPVWVAGKSIFLISDQAELIRLDSYSGNKIWGVKLPYYVSSNIKKRDKVFLHFGPVLAGGNLIVASSDGKIRKFNPLDGKSIEEVEFKGGATSSPAIANSSLYLLTDIGNLIAFK